MLSEGCAGSHTPRYDAGQPTAGNVYELSDQGAQSCFHAVCAHETSRAAPATDRRSMQVTQRRLARPYRDV